MRHFWHGWFGCNWPIKSRKSGFFLSKKIIISGWGAFLNPFELFKIQWLVVLVLSWRFLTSRWDIFATAGLAVFGRQSQAKFLIFVEIFLAPNQFLPLIQLVTILKIDLHAKFQRQIVIGSRVMAKKLFWFL